MSTPPRRLAALGPFAVLTVIAALAVGCSGAAAPSTSAPAASAPPGSSIPGGDPVASSPAPGSPGSVDGGAGGGSAGDPGTGIGLPIDPTPVDPAAGQPTIIVPKPGRLNPHPVAAQTIRASVDGRHVLVKIAWASGIAPCSVLDSVKVERSGHTIALTVIEGADEVDVMCAEIAMFKATIVDLGELDPGAWTITAPGGDAAPIELTIS